MTPPPSTTLLALLRQLSALSSVAERQRYLLQFQADFARELQPQLATSNHLSSAIIRKCFSNFGIILDKQLCGIIAKACLQYRRAKT